MAMGYMDDHKINHFKSGFSCMFMDMPLFAEK